MYQRGYTRLLPVVAPFVCAAWRTLGIRTVQARFVMSTARPTTTQTRKRKQPVKREDDASSDQDSTSVKQEDVAPTSTRGRRRVKHEEEEEASVKDEEESKEAPPPAAANHSGPSAPDTVDLDRVRLLRASGKLVPVTEAGAWRSSDASSSSGVAAAASASSSEQPESVVYWMTREHRVEDNWVLLYAQQVAASRGARLRIVFSLAPAFLGATERQYSFLLNGLREVESDLRQLHIPFDVLVGYAWTTLPAYVSRHRAGLVVTCFGPLRIYKEWNRRVAHELSATGTPLVLVDGHNIVPVWIASDKQEYAARTIRPKIHRHLGRFLTEFPRVAPGPLDQPKSEPIDWQRLDESLNIDRRVKSVAGLTPGPAAALDALHAFIRTRLHHYATRRNDPNAHHQSDLSPFLHFGHVAPQRCAIEVNKYRGRFSASVAAFIEELVVRRELSDNHCFYNEKYDSIDGASAWARDSLHKHAIDPREHVYTRGEFEFACTYDALWNAAQLEMVHTGKMHGFMRMYWAKKILEWSPTAEEALATSIYLNDRYSVDGRDANGYVGCAWSIIGTHDMGWSERAIFGKVRFMNFAGCKRKFDVERYCDAHARLGAHPGSSAFKDNQKQAKERDKEEAQQRQDARRASDATPVPSGSAQASALPAVAAAAAPSSGSA